MDTDQLVKKAQNLYGKKEYSAAAEQYRLAADAFHISGDMLQAAEMQNNQSVALAMGGEYQAAWFASKDTDAVFLAAGDLQKAGLACGNQAAALDGMGQTQEAARLYHRSAELLKQAGDQASRTAVLKSLTALQARRGDSLQALATAQAALNTGSKLSPREKLLKKLIDIPFKMLTKG